MRNAASSARIVRGSPPQADAALEASDDAPLRVGGVVPFSASDFPDRLAAVVFCQGCPWRCGYCHNPHLIPAGPASAEWSDVLAWLGKRRGLLDALVFSGGEPLAQPALVAAMRAVRAGGFAVGLHTGGAYPRRLAQALPHVDWVGLDIKAPCGEYGAVTDVPGSGDAAWTSLRLVMRSGVPFEVRTTVHALLTPTSMLVRLGRELAAAGLQRWVLQPFRAQGCAEPRLVAAQGAARIDERLLATVFPSILVRA